MNANRAWGKIPKKEDIILINKLGKSGNKIDISKLSFYTPWQWTVILSYDIIPEFHPQGSLSMF